MQICLDETVCLTSRWHGSTSSYLCHLFTLGPSKEPTKEDAMKQNAPPLPCTKRRQATKPEPLLAKLNNPGGEVASYANPAVTNAAASSKRVEPPPAKMVKSSSPDGSYRYDREFLLQMQFNPMCTTKPERLPDMEIVLDTPHTPTKSLTEQCCGGASVHDVQGMYNLFDM